VVERFKVRLVIGLAAVPMGVPHTRPVIITTHGVRNELVDRPNMWQGQLMVPASAQSVLELRLGQWGYDAMGYVAHVPHYLAQVDFPAAAVALLEAVQERADVELRLNIDLLRVTAAAAMTEIDQQVAEQEGESVLQGLEEQYDAFSRGAAESLLAAEGRCRPPRSSASRWRSSSPASTAATSATERSARIGACPGQSQSSSRFSTSSRST
jgi:hypothetical protein